MKPAPFEYKRPQTVEEAVALLSDDGARARVLAGGQSLVAEMNYRRARPARIVDINAIAALEVIEADGESLRVGALVRHVQLERGATDGPLGRLLTRVSRHVAHPPIRNRGTMVGSLAYAHPAAEWGAVAVALGAELRLASVGGTRVVAAEDFFRGPFVTDCGPAEFVTEVRLPALGAEMGVGFVELRRTHSSFAMVAAVAVLGIADGRVTDARIALANASSRPLRVETAEAVLVGARATPASFAAAAAAAAAQADPVSEPHASADYRRHAAEVLVLRALAAAAADVGAACA